MNECDPEKDVNARRRKLLAAVGGTGTITVAGCLGLFEEPDQRPDTSVDEPTEPTEATTGSETETETEDGGGETEAEDDGGETETETDLETFDIEWINEGATIEVPSNQALRESDLEAADVTDASLLYRALDEGLEPPWQCGRGVCGACTSKVDGNGTEFVEHGLGEYSNDYLSQEQIEAGYVLTCVGYPKRDFALETGVKDEADDSTSG